MNDLEPSSIGISSPNLLGTLSGDNGELGAGVPADTPSDRYSLRFLDCYDVTCLEISAVSGYSPGEEAAPSVG